MAQTDIHLKTLEDFEALIDLPENADLRFEFIDGEIIEVPSNMYSSLIATTIIFLIKLFLRDSKLGFLTGEQAGYIVVGARLSPDIAYLSKARQAEPTYSGYNPLAPDLAIEVISPSDRESDLRKKLSESQIRDLTPFRCAQPPLSLWRGAKNRQVLGVRFAPKGGRFGLNFNFRDSLKLAKYAEAGVVVWVFRPKTQSAEIHVPGKPVVTLSADDTLTGGDVLPGFTMTVKDAFAI